MEVVADLGERELLKRLAPWLRIGPDDNGGFGVGDDCAVLIASGDVRTVITTDLLVEGTHFLRNSATDWQLVGCKAAGANSSDLAAAGALPRALLVSVSLPPDFPVRDLESLYEGLSTTAASSGAEIIGGDTTRGRDVTISITAIGHKPATWADCLRSDAKPGDHLYLTGPLGASRAGLELLLSANAGSAVSAEDEYLRRRHFCPPSRVALAASLASRTSRIAMIDISDSLFNEAGLVAEASGVQLELWLDQVPVDPVARRLCDLTRQDPHRFALFSGEEYELLIASPAAPAQIAEHFRACGVETNLIHVGTVNPGSGVLLLQGGHPVDPSDETFSHFS